MQNSQKIAKIRLPDKIDKFKEDRYDQEGSIKIDNKNQVSFDPLRRLNWISRSIQSLISLIFIERPSLEEL